MQMHTWSGLLFTDVSIRLGTCQKHQTSVRCVPKNSQDQTVGIHLNRHQNACLWRQLMRKRETMCMHTLAIKPNARNPVSMLLGVW